MRALHQSERLHWEFFVSATYIINYSSFSEIGYDLIGRKSVFIINAIVFIGCFQLMILYFMIIGDILASFARQILNELNTFRTSRACYVIIVGVMLFPMIFKKEIHELKFASVMLFIAIFLFVVVLIFQLVSAGTDQNDDKDFKNYYNFHFDRQFFTAISVFMTAYSFQFNLFPILQSMKQRARREGL